MNYRLLSIYFTSWQFELKGGLEEIKRQNLLIESDLREEKARADVLLQELQGANEVWPFI